MGYRIQRAEDLLHLAYKFPSYNNIRAAIRAAQVNALETAALVCEAEPAPHGEGYDATMDCARAIRRLLLSVVS